MNKIPQMKKLFNKLACISILFFSLMIYSQETIEKSLVKNINDKELQWGPCPPFMPDGCNIAVLHGDPVKPNVDVLFRVSANSAIPNHWHNSAERMILLSGELEVTYEGEKPQIMKVGSYAYGPSKKPHMAKCGDSGPCTIFIAFEEPLDAFAIEGGK